MCGVCDPIFVLNTSKCFELKRELISGATANDSGFIWYTIRRQVYRIEESESVEEMRVSCVDIRLSLSRDQDLRWVEQLPSSILPCGSRTTPVDWGT